MGTDLRRGRLAAGRRDRHHGVGRPRSPRRSSAPSTGPATRAGPASAAIRDFGRDISEETHTFAVERQPGEIRWYVDGILYHRATPADVAPEPVGLRPSLLPAAEHGRGRQLRRRGRPRHRLPAVDGGGLRPGLRGPGHRGALRGPLRRRLRGLAPGDRAVHRFQRSAHQPHGAPNDGFGRTQVWGYGFVLPEGGTRAGDMWLARVELDAPRARDRDHAPPTAARVAAPAPGRRCPRAARCPSPRAGRPDHRAHAPVRSCSRRT